MSVLKNRLVILSFIIGALAAPVLLTLAIYALLAAEARKYPFPIVIVTNPFIDIDLPFLRSLQLSNNALLVFVALQVGVLGGVICGGLVALVVALKSAIRGHQQQKEEN